MNIAFAFSPSAKEEAMLKKTRFLEGTYVEGTLFFISFSERLTGILCFPSVRELLFEGKGIFITLYGTRAFFAMLLAESISLLCLWFEGGK